mmetsp:Transcript_16670/g.35811  ORF Transcript_16670/g.35811 Transcript_16670/m.35811 type:complete len:566 (-) Transcript_16670:85-1782(-)
MHSFTHAHSALEVNNLHHSSPHAKGTNTWELTSATKYLLTIDTASPLQRLEDQFGCVTLDWWPPSKCDYGRCAWGNTSLLNVDLGSIRLRNALRGLTPVYLRLGGSLADSVRYNVPGAELQGKCDTDFEMPTNDTRVGYPLASGCITASRWDALNELCASTGCSLVFGLNGLTGRSFPKCPAGTNCHFESRQHACCTDWSGAWDPSNTEALLLYTKRQGHSVWGFELGNELGGTGGIGAHISASQYADDFCILASLVLKIWPSGASRPKIIAPDNNFDATWFSDFLRHTTAKGCAPDVVTHHQYILGAGFDPRSEERALSPSTLDRQKVRAATIGRVVREATGAQKPQVWVGEGGGAYNSGRHGLTDRFHSSFWYLDGLGVLAQQGHQAYCRQTLIGGNYGLLNTTTYTPNPDYYALLLWQRLMGKGVLNTSITISPTRKLAQASAYLRGYAHCTDTERANGGDVSLMLINLSNNTRFPVELAGLRLDGVREDYVMSSESLASDKVALNGAFLISQPDGTLPAMKPKFTAPASTPIMLEPHSYSFHVIRGSGASACSMVFTTGTV